MRATVTKVKGRGRFWFRDNASRILGIVAQAGTEAPIGLIKKESTKPSTARQNTTQHVPSCWNISSRVKRVVQPMTREMGRVVARLDHGSRRIGACRKTG